MQKLCKRVLTAITAVTVLGSVHAFADTVIIENVNLIDGTGGQPKPGMTVIVEDGRFTTVTPDAAAPDADGTRIDGTGKYLIPGLMDMHIHLKGGVTVTEQGLREAGSNKKEGKEALASFLYSGVTSVYDSGNNPDYILGLRDEERKGDIMSPRIFATGGIVTYPDSHGSGPGYTPVDDWPEAIPALDKHIARKPDVLKLTFEERGWGARPMIPLLPTDLIQKITEYYNDHGIRVTVHTSSERRARQAIFAGVDNLSHPVIQGPITDEFALLMAAKKIPMVSTLAIGENYSRLVDHPEHLDQALYQASLSNSEIKRLKTETYEEWKERAWTWWMKLMTPIAQENIRKVHDAGGVVVLGTDQTIGPAVHREMELLAGAGIKPADIIRIATLNGAMFLGREADMGSIEEGKLADAVLLNADPTKDIDNAKNIFLVMKNGVIIDEDDLPLAGKAEKRNHP